VRINTEKIIRLIKLKLKFGASSIVATLCDLSIFFFLTRDEWLQPEIAQGIASSTGMLINFFLQKKYVFDIQRRTRTAFFMSIGISLMGILISIGIIHVLTTYTPLKDYIQVAKLMTIGTMFFYNFYLKRFAFEKRFLD
jgi:putative flippase GtrA